MKKLVLSFLMIVVLVSGVFCQTFTTTSGKTVNLSTAPVINASSLVDIGDAIVVVVLATSDDTGDKEVVEIDGVIYQVVK